MSWLRRLFSGDKYSLHTLLARHFHPHRLGSLVVHQRKFPLRVQADLQRAIDDLMADIKVHHFSSIQQQLYASRNSFATILMDDPALCAASLATPQYEEIDVGDAEPVRSLKDGLWLVEENGCRFAVLLASPNEFDYMGQSPGLRLQVAVPKDSSAALALVQRLFERLEKSVQAGRSYRGKVLSLEAAANYSGRLASPRCLSPRNR